FALRLRLSGTARDRLLALGGDGPEDDADDGTLRRVLADAPRAILVDRAWLAGRSNRLHARLAAMPVPVFPLQGRDLAEAGMAPGPEIGRRLAELRNWWWQGGCKAGRVACLAEHGCRTI
ncbi:MAG: CCA tRNA nucleotidyltransferase, partial [Acetobacteraceae bacterium]|nr:CCA tRNA nucleotidyltransferase [Acetobacteraceae bacterium]